MLDYRTETFLTVCKALNFTTAAKQLNITQPAVSQHIHFLEKQYNTTLFAYKNKELSIRNIYLLCPFVKFNRDINIPIICYMGTFSLIHGDILSVAWGH